MEIKFLNQPKEVKLSDLLSQRLISKFDEVYFITGMAKDSGFETIADALKQCSEYKTKLNLFIGIDRKNTSKDALLNLLSLNCKLHVHINTDDDKVETRAYVFESQSGDSYIYMTGAKFSVGGLEENLCVIEEIKYEANEKKAFDLAKNSILQGTLQCFHEINSDEVILLAEKGEIVARIIDRKIPKITELYGKSEQEIGEQVYDESQSSININFDELDDIDIDIENSIGIRENVELSTEKEQRKEQREKMELLENIARSGASIDKLYEKKDNKIDGTKKGKIHKSEKADFSNMTTLIIEAGKISENSMGECEFKIPKELSENIGEYFNKENVTFEILDNLDNQKEIDDCTIIKKSEKGTSIKSAILGIKKPVEGDLIRIIKLEDGKYRCEIIRQSTEEFNVWSAYLVNNIRGQKRRYGII